MPRKLQQQPVSRPLVDTGVLLPAQFQSVSKRNLGPITKLKTRGQFKFCAMSFLQFIRILRIDGKERVIDGRFKIGVQIKLAQHITVESGRLKTRKGFSVKK